MASLIIRKWDGFIIFWEILRFLVIYRHWRLNVLICVWMKIAKKTSFLAL